jgi:NAD(P)-dependent dehydrogenase (short-subunit alcohol dehydrogenase family)
MVSAIKTMETMAVDQLLELGIMSLVKKVAIVTGAGTGIGRAVSAALGAQGMYVALSGRRREGLEATAKLVEAAGGRAFVCPTDVTSPESVAALFSSTVEHFGRVDLLVNNAGTATPGVPIDELTYEQWRGCIDTNLTGSFLCTQSAFKQFKAQTPMGGRIINNGSISAQTPRPNSAPYTSTKHAITGLTKSCALDGRAFNISCGQIDIGNAFTEMTTPMRNGIAQADGSKKVEPMMDVQHVADAVVYMASLPPSANVLQMTVMATNMPFVGRG